MTIARAEIVDLSLTRWYHCVLRCVRGASLLAQGEIDRKAWIEDRLEKLAEIFAVSVGAYSILDDRFHVLVRLDPKVASDWSDSDVARRYGAVVPPRNGRDAVPISTQWIKQCTKDSVWMAKSRERLQSLGWFMKALKEPLARLANRQDQTRGTFFEGRFKSVAVLDQESLLAACTFIDLSPVAAGVAATPGASAYTSIKARVQHLKADGWFRELNAARRGEATASNAIARLDESLWLCPIGERKRRGLAREGMFQEISLANYLVLAEYTGRLYRGGRVAVPAEVSEIFSALGTTPEAWWSRQESLNRGRLFGRFFAASRERLREVAQERGLQHLANLAGCKTR